MNHARLDAWFHRATEAARALRETLRARLGPRVSAVLPWLGIVLILVWFQGHRVVQSVGRNLDPFLVNGDARQQIYPFFRYLTPSAFREDYIADYYLACLPVGYRSMYTAAAWIGIDPVALSGYLPLFLWLLTVACLGVVAHQLAGRLGALAAMALMLGSNAYLERMGGGLPRAFGFPILAGTLVALSRARPWWGAVCVALGALFYPVTAVISGLSLAGMLLLPGAARLEATSWSWKRRLTFVSGTALLAVALLLPTVVASSRFGDVITPGDTGEFPEAGPGGRYAPNDRPPFKSFLAAAISRIDITLLGARPPFSHSARAWLMDGDESKRVSARYDALKTVLLVGALLGALGVLARRPAARRVLLLGVASVLGHELARLVAPYAYLPDRYVTYTVPLLVTLAVASSVGGLFPLSFDVGRRLWLRTASVGAYVATLLFLLGGSISPNIGLDVDLRPRRQVLEAVAQLPLNAVVAGWPLGAIDDVPYFARRRVLLTQEVHQAFHKGYAKEMRRRMRALIDGYFATSLGPILRLRDELGVTHLLVQRSHLRDRPLRYFEPFNRSIAQRHQAGRERGFELPRQFEQAGVFRYRDYVLLDLSRLAKSATNSGPK